MTDTPRKLVVIDGETHRLTRAKDNRFWTANFRYKCRKRLDNTQVLAELKDNVNNVDRFVALAKRFVCIEELTPEILRTFISKIVVYERSEKCSKKATQQIDIYFTHIGMISA